MIFKQAQTEYNLLYLSKNQEEDVVIGASFIIQSQTLLKSCPSWFNKPDKYNNSGTPAGNLFVLKAVKHKQLQ